MAKKHTKEDKHYLDTRVEVNDDDCWVWTGATNGKYGIMRRRGKRYTAHRFAFMIYNKGVNIKKRKIGQTCGEPLCCNPEHLHIVGQSKEKEAPVRMSRSLAEGIRMRLAGGESVGSVAGSLGLSVTFVERIEREEIWK